jgi:hypothetical protein
MKRSLLLGAAISVAAASPAFASSGGDGNIFPGLIMLGIMLGAYFLPTILAAIREHPNVVAIGLLNLLVGWTGIGWLAALIWSVISLASRERVIYIENNNRQSPPPLPPQF